MMRCSQAQPNLKAFADGEVSWLAAWRIRRHVARCSRCRQDLDAIRALTRTLGEADRAAPPSYLRSRILASLPPTMPPHAGPAPAHAPRAERLPRYALPAAGAVLCTILAAWIVVRHPARPAMEEGEWRAAPLRTAAKPPAEGAPLSPSLPPAKGQRLPAVEAFRAASSPAAQSPAPVEARRAAPQRTAAQPPAEGPPPRPSIPPAKGRHPLPPRPPLMVASAPQAPAEPLQTQGTSAKDFAAGALPFAARMMKSGAPVETARPAPSEGPAAPIIVLDFTVPDLPAAEDAVRRIARSVDVRVQEDHLAEEPSRQMQRSAEGLGPRSGTNRLPERTLIMLIPENRLQFVKDQLAKDLPRPSNAIPRPEGSSQPENRGAGASGGAFGGLGGAPAPASRADTGREVRVIVHLRLPGPPPAAPSSSTGAPNPGPAK